MNTFTTHQVALEIIGMNYDPASIYRTPVGHWADLPKSLGRRVLRVEKNLWCWISNDEVLEVWKSLPEAIQQQWRGSGHLCKALEHKGRIVFIEYGDTWRYRKLPEYKVVADMISTNFVDKNGGTFIR